MQINEERIAILGASRGLGLAIASKLLAEPQSQLWLSSRKIHLLRQTELLQKYSERCRLTPFDFTKTDHFNRLVEEIDSFSPHRLIYCAGGGPFGKFHEKPWHSHLWALQLNFLFPAQLLHHLLTLTEAPFNSLKQIIFVGSSIAESMADPGAASYAAAKHGLKGLIHSLIDEGVASKIEVRLYSPGYMDTTMLPPNARPRQDGSLIAHPEEIADDLVLWMRTPLSQTLWHRIPKFDKK
jgi:short-subunit dehydrogenase